MEFLVAVPSFGVNLYPNLVQVSFSYRPNYVFVKEGDPWMHFGEMESGVVGSSSLSETIDI